METHARLSDTIRTAGFAFVPAARMRALLEHAGPPSAGPENAGAPSAGPLSDWATFAASWDDLGLDTYMADGGRYRKRRHAVFSVAADGITRLPAQPHYQSRDYNPLNGGIERWFEPVLPAIGDGPTMTTILHFCRTLFGQLTPPAMNGEPPSWHVEVHQFRIEARVGETGRPTPEGMHRDGVDYVLVLLIGRRNIASGVTSVHDLAGTTLGSFTLTQPLDAALVDDARVMHGVTPVEAVDPTVPGFRDVLVVTFRRP